VNKFAVITRSQRQKFFKRPTIIEYDSHYLLELPYTVEQIRTVDENKLHKSLAKGIRKLQQMGVSRAIFTNDLKKIFDTNIRLQNFRVVDGTLLFFDFVPKMVVFLYKKYEFEPPNIRISIREENLSFIGQKLIEQLCYDGKFISVATADIVSAKQYANFLLDKLGIMLEIRNIVNVSEDNEDNIVIDVDNFSVSVPNGETLDGMEIEGIPLIEDAEIFDVMMCCGLGANDISVTKWKTGEKFVDIA